MRDAMANSLYFGMAISVATYMFGIWLKKKVKWQVCNPLLISTVLVILFLTLTHITYNEYMEGAQYISYFLTPATVCLAIPLYKQLEMLKRNKLAVLCGILAGVVANAVTVFVMCLLFRLEHVHYVTFLPKSITTAIGMGVSEEAGGIVILTIVSIMITGIGGVILSESLFKLFRLKDPVAKGLALGTASHAIGTSKALEMGEIEGAMSSLAIAVTGLVTVVVVPLIADFI